MRVITTRMRGMAMEKMSTMTKRKVSSMRKRKIRVKSNKQSRQLGP
jgi:hypothetical protein